MSAMKPLHTRKADLIMRRRVTTYLACPACLHLLTSPAMAAFVPSMSAVFSCPSAYSFWASMMMRLLSDGVAEERGTPIISRKDFVWRLWAMLCGCYCCLKMCKRKCLIIVQSLLIALQNRS